MKKDKDTTRVIFRDVTYGPGDTELLALFPDQKWETSPGTVWSYAHIGQHSAADYNYILEISKPALPSEALTSLVHELESIGYNLKIIKRATRQK